MLTETKRCMGTCLCEYLKETHSSWRQQSLKCPEIVGCLEGLRKTNNDIGIE